MSHFTVLVITDSPEDVEGAMAPFQENNMGGKNPNAKWDWYQIGGRWTGFFKMNLPVLPGLEGFTEAEIRNLLKLYQTDRDKFIFVTSGYTGKEIAIRTAIETLNTASGRLGEPGLLTQAPKQGYADQALKKDIDFEGMLADAEREANEQFDKVEAALSNLNYPDDRPLTWRQVLNQFPDLHIDEKRVMYNQQPVVQALEKANLSMFMECEIEVFHLHEADSRAKYVADRRCAAFSTFAVLYEGGWYERGDMGWFGAVFDEKPKYDWSAQFIDIIDSLPDTACLTVVDCHI